MNFKLGLTVCCLLAVLAISIFVPWQAPSLRFFMFSHLKDFAILTLSLFGVVTWGGRGWIDETTDEFWWLRVLGFSIASTIFIAIIRVQ
jgi:hypothetical protein